MVKKAEMSITVMIALVLALGVLITLAILLTRSTNQYSTAVFDCESKGGSCVPNGECTSTKSTFNCPKGKVCCFNSLG